MRLIDADALPKYTGYALSADEVATAVENAPTIDAVPVVRCGECKRCKTDVIYGEMWCDGCRVAKDHYCGYGKRREDGDNNE